MAFVDEVHIHAGAGHGGPGVVRWLHAKGKEKGGPSGGDGGRGGDIILRGVRDLAALAHYRFAKKFRAENGAPGGSNDKHGKDGATIYLNVPVGTVAKNCTTQELIEVLEEGQEYVIFRGGQGGLGNPHFKSATNQNPSESTPGKQGGVGDIHITLKLIAEGSRTQGSPPYSTRLRARSRRSVHTRSPRSIRTSESSMAMSLQMSQASLKVPRLEKVLAPSSFAT
jgi:GTP-binding protein